MPWLRNLLGASRSPAVAITTTPQDERQAQVLWWLWAHCYLPAMERDLRLRMARATDAPLDELEPPPAAPAADDAQLAGWLEGIQRRENQP